MLPFDILTDGASVLKEPHDTLDNWMQDAFMVRLNRFGTDLLCYSPTAYPYRIDDHQPANRLNFISLSVTGVSCSLNCEHCKGRLLKGMEPALTPQDLYDKCRMIKDTGGQGVLISGGSDSKGHVPLDRFVDTIASVKRNLGLQVVVHTGLATRSLVESLASANIDAAMLDIIGDADVAHRVYHLENGPERMKETLLLYHEYGVPTVPHVLVGLDYGKLHGELEALDMISQTSPTAVVIIALSPLRNTPMAHVNPPAPVDIARVLTIARLGMPDIPLLLGCARPMGPHKIETDKFAIRSGVNGIALISQEGVDFGRDLGLIPRFADVCCSLAYQHVKLLS